MAQLIVLAREGALERAGGILRRLVGAIAGGIQGVVDRVAQVVGDVGQAVRGIVGVGQIRAIGLGDLRHLADVVVGEGGDDVVGRSRALGVGAHGAREQPAARVVGHIGDGAVGVLRPGNAAVEVVADVGGALAERVGDLVEITEGVTRTAHGSTAGGIGRLIIGVA